MANAEAAEKESRVFSDCTSRLKDVHTSGHELNQLCEKRYVEIELTAGDSLIQPHLMQMVGAYLRSRHPNMPFMLPRLNNSSDLGRRLQPLMNNLRTLETTLAYLANLVFISNAAYALIGTHQLSPWLLVWRITLFREANSLGPNFQTQVCID
jgi:hypothetical protein